MSMSIFSTVLSQLVLCLFCLYILRFRLSFASSFFLLFLGFKVILFSLIISLARFLQKKLFVSEKVTQSRSSK